MKYERNYLIFCATKKKKKVMMRKSYSESWELGELLLKCLPRGPKYEYEYMMQKKLKVCKNRKSSESKLCRIKKQETKSTTVYSSSENLVKK